MNFFRDIAPGTTERMNVVVEIPKGSQNKYEIDKATGMVALDRVLHSAQTYPFDYGFVPQTLWDDDDALDVVLLTTFPLPPAILAPARPVAIMHMIDSGEPDDKIIAVPAKDPRFAHIKDLADLNPHTVKEIAHFFSTYKQLEGKEVSVGEFEGRAAAEAAFLRAVKLYREKQ